MLEEILFIKIRGSFFVMMHNTTRKIKNSYVQIQKLFQIERHPKMNIFSVMKIKIVFYSTQYHL